MSNSSRRFIIGYALSPKKVQSFVLPSLINHAKQRGIDLIPIDIYKPLTEQGPFDCVVHKLYDEDWKKQLEEFTFKNPNVVIIDPLNSIEPLHNRISMLEVVKRLEIESLGIPKQVVVNNIESLSNPKLLEDSKLRFPVIAKPLVADGSAISHEMWLVFNIEGFRKIKPPIILQEFVNHGGVIFKIYVAGDYVKCVQRRSLPDISNEKLGDLGDVMSFSQISNLTSQQLRSESEGYDNCSYLNIESAEEAEMPPHCFIMDVARGLQWAMKLHLFNFDLIRDARNRYLVIDINYFPGYAKMPGFETILTCFFWDAVNGKIGNLHNVDTEEG
ncbi:hypothetical protein Nepgr_010963 [Nepenthes gracilis]|uniref:Inositol-tetrakisphosphate 1-kinase n=1 Tax=Nepenthes gracilis TaxID=150966 RepID=A0AAD3SDB6_NEPGR|nr:hypothetical protein Nepgr_010963 [Nepenthes gracilis]